MKFTRRNKYTDFTYQNDVASTYKNSSEEEAKTKTNATGSPLQVLCPAGLTQQLLTENILNTSIKQSKQRQNDPSS
jgi:hypothetical protein